MRWKGTHRHRRWSCWGRLPAKTPRRPRCRQLPPGPRPQKASSFCRTYWKRRACLRGRCLGCCVHATDPGWGPYCPWGAADGSDAADVAGRTAAAMPCHPCAAGRVQARWGAATGHRPCVCWAFADRESVEYGRFATSFAYPSSFALWLIVFYLGLHYSD